jgi:hypothetical protein
MIKEHNHGQESHPVDARRADLGTHPAQHIRCHLSTRQTSSRRSGRAPEPDAPEPLEISAVLVSDYVAGRLDAMTARLVELAAERDPMLRRTIAEARATRSRVKQRLTGQRS